MVCLTNSKTSVFSYYSQNDIQLLIYIWVVSLLNMTNPWLDCSAGSDQLEGPRVHLRLVPAQHR